MEILLLFLFVLCINLSNVTDVICHRPYITSLQWIRSFSGRISLMLHAGYIMIYSLSLFPLLFVTFCFYWYKTCSPSAKGKTSFCDISTLWLFHQGFFLNAKIEDARKNNWMEMPHFWFSDYLCCWVSMSNEYDYTLFSFSLCCVKADKGFCAFTQKLPSVSQAPGRVN